MRGFDFKSFVDLSLVFSAMRGEPSPALPWQSALREYPQSMMSRFMETKEEITTFKSRFYAHSSNDNEIKIDVPHISSTFSIVGAHWPKPPQPVSKTEEPKPRTTLKLKTKVELPVMPTTISRRSTSEDLIAAFKAEMKMLDKRDPSEIKDMPLHTETPSERKRHPLSHKTWAELLAEVDAPKKSTPDIDLAKAFKTEMQMMLAEQQKTGEISPIRLKSSFEPKVVPSIPVTPSISAPKLRFAAR